MQRHQRACEQRPDRILERPLRGGAASAPFFRQSVRRGAKRSNINHIALGEQSGAAAQWLTAARSERAKTFRQRRRLGPRRACPAARLNDMLQHLQG